MANLRIRELIEESRRRVGRRVTQTELAKAAGVTQQTITRLANNQRKRLDPVILQSIADCFTEALGREITIDDLIQKDGRQVQESSITPSEPVTIEDKIDHLSQQMASVRGDIADMRQDMAAIQDAISK